MILWERIQNMAEQEPSKQALGHLTYGKLSIAVKACVGALSDVNGKKIGLCISNRPLWAIYDIALTLRGAIVVPIPLFFSNEQVKHIVSDSRLDAVIVESGVGFEHFGVPVIWADAKFESAHVCAGVTPSDGAFARINKKAPAKIIYTSGTTGAPKGVVVSHEAIEEVTGELIVRSDAAFSDRHLSLLPLSTLVEAIGGLYVPLSVGATVHYPLSADQNNAALSLKAVVEAFVKFSPTTLNLVPALLRELTEMVSIVPEAVKALRFVACGGAPLSKRLMEKALALGIPLYEGYGLSECVTVVSLNAPGDARKGSVGRPLLNRCVRISEDGEIMVSGAALMSGYLNKDFGGNVGEWATGDLGRIDEDGFLYVHGRKDTVLSTSLGRNVAPEWVEGEIASSAAIKRTVVFGHGRPFLTALVTLKESWIAEAIKRFSLDGGQKAALGSQAITSAIRDEIKKAMLQLPEYSRVKGVLVVTDELGGGKGVDRKAAMGRYEQELESMYESLENKNIMEDVYVCAC